MLLTDANHKWRIVMNKRLLWTKFAKIIKKQRFTDDKIVFWGASPGLPTIEDNAQLCTSMHDLYGKWLIMRSTYAGFENPQNSFVTE